MEVASSHSIEDGLVRFNRYFELVLLLLRAILQMMQVKKQVEIVRLLQDLLVLLELANVLAVFQNLSNRDPVCIVDMRPQVIDLEMDLKQVQLLFIELSVTVLAIVDRFGSQVEQLVLDHASQLARLGEYFRVLAAEADQIESTLKQLLDDLVVALELNDHQQVHVHQICQRVLVLFEQVGVFLDQVLGEVSQQVRIEHHCRSFLDAEVVNHVFGTRLLEVLD